MIGFYWRLGAMALLCASLAACQLTDHLTNAAASSEPDLAPEALAAEPTMAAIDWSPGQNCLAMLSTLETALAKGTITGLDDTPFILISDGPAAHGGRWSSFGNTATLSSGRPSDSSEARCVLRVGRASEQESDHKVLDREQVRSRYQSGTRSEKNPAYEVAKARLRQAEKAAKPGKSSIIKVGDPLLDLVGTVVGGALTGFGQWGSGDQLEEALDTLMATPPSIEHPIYKSYHFERARVRASREATLPVTLTDRRLQRSWKASLRRLEHRELFLLSGLDRQDEDYARHSEDSVTKDGLRQWLAEAPSPSLADVTAVLLQRSSTAPIDRVALSIDDAETADEAHPSDDIFLDAAALPDALSLRDVYHNDIQSSPPETGHAISRIRIIGEKASAEGVFIAPQFILSPSDVIGGRGLVDIEDRPGHVALGLVASVDHGLGLALIQAPLTGRPVAVGRSALSSSSDVLSIDEREHKPRTSSSGPIGSAPILAGGRLVGFKMARGPNIRGDAIRTFLDQQRHLLPIAP